MDSVKKILSAFCLGSAIALSAQGYQPKVNNIPTSPEAALMERFGEIPVGYYNGSPNIDVPLYTIKVDEFTLPLALRYNSSGIKVADEATWVGLGWDFSPGGYIIQEVRGRRDEMDSPTLNTAQASYDFFMNRILTSGGLGSYKEIKQLGNNHYIFNCPTQCFNGACSSYGIFEIPGLPPNAEDGALLNALRTGHGDPDIYHYNLGGYMGKFYVNPQTQAVVFIDNKDGIKIIKGGDQTNPTIEAKLPDGTSYFFGSGGREISHGNLPVNDYYEKSGSTFKVTKITLTSGKSIDFEYQDGQVTNLRYSQFAYLNSCYGGPQPNNLPTPQLPNSSPYDISQVKILKKITTPDLRIDFVLADREDTNLRSTDSHKKLQSVDIFSKTTNKKLKSFQLTTSYFPHGSSPPIGNYQLNTAVLAKRLRLDAVKEIGYTQGTTQTADLSKPAHVFEYDQSVMLPLKTSNAIDFYGYYNGASNTSLTPDLDYYDYPYEFMGATNNVPFVYTNYTKGNRYANNDYAKAGLIKKITYPTGGHTTFEFEPHTFTNQPIPSQQQVNSMFKYYSATGGMMPSWSSNSQTVTLQGINASVTMSFQVSFSHGNPIMSMTDQSPNNIAKTKMWYESSVTLVKVSGNGSGVETPVMTWVPGNFVSLQNWQLPGFTGIQQNVTYRLNYQAGYVYKIRATFPAPQAFNPVPYFPGGVAYAANSNINVRYFGRLLEGTEYQGGGLRVKTITSYTSVTDPSPTIKNYVYHSGKILTDFNPLAINDVYCFNCTSTRCDSPCGNMQTMFTRELFVDSRFLQHLSNYVGYGKVEEILGTSTYNIGRKEFDFHNQPNMTSNGFPDVPNAITGLQTAERTYDRSGTLLHKKTFTYQDYIPGVTVFYGVRLKSNYYGNTDPVEGPNGTSRSKFSYLCTPILSQAYKIADIKEYTYLGASSVDDITTITYNNYGQVATETRHAGQLEETMRQYLYATDNPIGTNEPTLVAANFINVPLQIKTIRNGQQVSMTQEEYMKDGYNHIIQTSVSSKKDSQSLEKRVRYDAYDAKGNLTVFKQENGKATLLVYGYDKTMPVAKLENLDYPAIPFASEDDITLYSAAGTYNESLLSAALANLRTLYPTALVTTYLYAPGQGVKTITDPKGDSKNYIYDNFGKLKEVRNAQSELISEHNYHYKP
ncbi:RHS repeat domain-containing protein [Flavobacterium selenitireducens]|uniref:hypothetical protein n=1 Tax=Flavobacterium selenitireducens TaxID=2722704 RepID=UPI00168A5B15|nr:hypothetical protein [Flavobacterium selenitireducens]MBD3582196.1 hypothetical protein [Flavobacterium selenitireducens]